MSPKPASLDETRKHLKKREETIIFKMLNRAQYKHNPSLYEEKLHARLQDQEVLDSHYKRYKVLEERPFIIQGKGCPKHTFIQLPDLDTINLTPLILKAYLHMLPELCEEGDDHQYGSSLEHDVTLLQTVSERVHYGAFYIAEAKYQAEPELYESLKKDPCKLLELLTNKEVERKIYQRVRNKAEVFQADIDPAINHIVNPDVIVDYYVGELIPLTKLGEVMYLMKRSNPQGEGLEEVKEQLSDSPYYKL
ncbi:MAG: chorismate mutase [Planctomycetes bacterium]|nr:chorismate mutase [Planctomycetota bacterium]